MLVGLTEGRIVHYVLTDRDVCDIPLTMGRPAAGVERAAIVVNSWPGLDRDDGYANLLVFMDGQNDGLQLHEAPLRWVTSRIRSAEGKEPGTWHWPQE